MKEPMTGKLWYLLSNGEPEESRYVFTVGHDDETHEDRLNEFLADNPQYERMLTPTYTDVPALGVKSIVPKHDMKPLDMLLDEGWKKRTFDARDAIVEYMNDKDETTVEKLAAEIRTADPLPFALAIQWMVEERWVVQSYKLRRRDTGKLLAERYWEPLDIPDEIYDGDEQVPTNNLDLYSEILKTAIFGRV